MTEPTSRIGVLGGTFDPPHVGHAIVALDLLERLELDRLLVVPAPHPPHRAAALPAAVRLDLVRTMFRGVDRVEVCDVEYGRPAPSWTFDTLALLRERHPRARLLLAIGSDQFAVFDTWHEYRRIPDLADLVVMRRAGEEPRPPAGMDPIAYITVDVTRIDLSASRIRERLRAGRPIRFFVPESIRHHIERAWDSRAHPEPASTGC